MGKLELVLLSRYRSEAGTPAHSPMGLSCRFHQSVSVSLCISNKKGKTDSEGGIVRKRRVEGKVHSEVNGDLV